MLVRVPLNRRRAAYSSGPKAPQKHILSDGINPVFLNCIEGFLFKSKSAKLP
jgi:hypothetical protein